MTDVRVKVTEDVSKIIKVGFRGPAGTGINVVSATITPADELIFTLSDGSTISAGFIDVSGSNSVDNISQLMISATTAPVQVLGYHTKGDYGGGLFYFDVTCSQSLHDGGMVIDRNMTATIGSSNWYNTPENTGLGAWRRLLSDGIVNLKQFGAKGISTDDTLPIQAAINYISKTNDYSLYAPSGYYKYSKLYFYHDSILNPNFLIPTSSISTVDNRHGKFRIYGDGAIEKAKARNWTSIDIFYGSILETTVTNSEDSFIVSPSIYDAPGYPARDFVIENLTLYGEKNNGYILTAAGCSGVNLKDAAIIQGHKDGHGAYIHSPWLGSITNTIIYNHTQPNSSALHDNTGYGVHFGTSVGAGIFNITNLVFDGFKHNFYNDANNTEFFTNLSFNSVAFQGSTEEAFKSYSSISSNVLKEITFNDCYWERNGGNLNIRGCTNLKVSGGYMSLGDESSSYILSTLNAVKLHDVNSYEVNNVFLFRPYKHIFKIEKSSNTTIQSGELKNIQLYHDYPENVVGHVALIEFGATLSSPVVSNYGFTGMYNSGFDSTTATFRVVSDLTQTPISIIDNDSGFKLNKISTNVNKISLAGGQTVLLSSYNDTIHDITVTNAAGLIFKMNDQTMQFNGNIQIIRCNTASAGYIIVQNNANQNIVVLHAGEHVTLYHDKASSTYRIINENKLTVDKYSEASYNLFNGNIPAGSVGNLSLVRMGTLTGNKTATFSTNNYIKGVKHKFVAIESNLNTNKYSLGFVGLSGNILGTISNNQWIEFSVFSPTEMYISGKGYNLDTYQSTGIINSVPTFTATGLTLSVSGCDIAIYDNPTFSGVPLKYTVTQATFSLTDNVTNYICVDYNNGNPIYINTPTLSLINESNVIPINTILCVDGYIHLSHWDNIANGLSNKLHRRFVKTQRYARESGLELSVSTFGTVSIAEGIVWRGARDFNLNSFNSDSNPYFLYYHSGGVWTSDLITTGINNTQYDNGTDLVSLSNPNKFTINWIWRGVEDHEHGYVVLGDKEYKDLPTAIAETTIPTVPVELSSHAILVGRVIVQNGLNDYHSEGAFDRTFVGTVINDHNELSNIQGGTLSEYYHLDLSHYNIINSLSTTGTYVAYNNATLAPISYVDTSLNNHNTSSIGIHSTLSGTVIAGQKDILTPYTITTNSTLSIDYSKGNSFYVDMTSISFATISVTVSVINCPGAGYMEAFTLIIKTGATLPILTHAITTTTLSLTASKETWYNYFTYNCNSFWRCQKGFQI